MQIKVVIMFEKSKWIWQGEEQKPNQRVNFFFNARVDCIPSSAILKIGCETKYWLFVNGRLVVFDGGLFRESLPSCGYFDEVDVAPFLKVGENEFCLHVWYFGNGGRNNNFCPKAGLIFECDCLGLYSNEVIESAIDDAYYTTETENPSYLYGGDNVAYNAQKTRFSLCPEKKAVATSRVVGEYGDSPWGQLVKRPVPLLRFSERGKSEYEKTQTGVKVKLPYAMHFSPYFKVEAKGGEVIDVRSDRYYVNGGPGDNVNKYAGHRVEYVCTDGEQEFEMLDWVFGEEIIFTMPDTIRVIELGYRESGYDSAIVSSFECDNERVNKLVEKCKRTLLVCMRENFMDCPDRERGQWIGDVSVQAPQIVYLLDDNGMLLFKKAVYDFINLRKGDVLVGNVPGDNFTELPSQSLNAISEWGMVASYYKATGDKEILKLCLEPSINYLKLWNTDSEGVVLPRKGNWEWYDHLFNIDNEVLNICWYYSALNFAGFMASELGITDYNDFINDRKHAIKAVFEKRYWKEGYYGSGNFADDRANAMAVLSGLCDKKKYPAIRYLLLSVFNSTTYMENYVLTALCEMGYKQDAFNRMMARYYPLIENDNSTLWEDFYHLGTKNHAWSGAPVTILFKYFAGVQGDLSVTETDIAPLKYLKCEFKNKKGEKQIVEKKTV